MRCDPGVHVLLLQLILPRLFLRRFVHLKTLLVEARVEILIGSSSELTGFARQLTFHCVIFELQNAEILVLARLKIYGLIYFLNE